MPLLSSIKTVTWKIVLKHKLLCCILNILSAFLPQGSLHPPVSLLASSCPFFHLPELLPPLPFLGLYSNHFLFQAFFAYTIRSRYLWSQSALLNLLPCLFLSIVSQFQINYAFYLFIFYFGVELGYLFVHRILPIAVSGM